MSILCWFGLVWLNFFLVQKAYFFFFRVPIIAKPKCLGSLGRTRRRKRRKRSRTTEDLGIEDPDEWIDNEDWGDDLSETNPCQGFNLSMLSLSSLHRLAEVGAAVSAGQFSVKQGLFYTSDFPIITPRSFLSFPQFFTSSYFLFPSFPLRTNSLLHPSSSFRSFLYQFFPHPTFSFLSFLSSFLHSTSSFFYPDTEI